MTAGLTRSSSTAQPWLDQAVRHHRAGRLPDAIAAYRKVLRITPQNFDALHMLGVALSQAGQDGDGIATLREAIKLNPASTAARGNLAQALLKARRFEEALPLYSALVSLGPGTDSAFAGLGQCHLELGRPAEAERILLDAARRFPRSAAIFNELGKSRMALAKHGDAIQNFRQAVVLDPGFHMAASNLGGALIEANDYESAERVLSKVLAVNPTLLTARYNLANLYRKLFQSEKAIRLAEETLKSSPEDPQVRTLLGLCYIDLGRNEDAERYLREAIARGESLSEALSGLAQIHKFKAGEPELALASSLLADQKLDARSRKSLLFTISKMEDDIGHPGAAVDYAIAAKAISPLPDRFEQHRSFVHAAMTALGPEFFAARRALGHPSEQPVFIIGMPRSGTTLTEQIIASHAQADGAGELNVLSGVARKMGFDNATLEAFLSNITALGANDLHGLAEAYLPYLRRNAKEGALRISDKLPHNFQNVWLIAMLFPNARIIHCNRNPVDVCMSIFLRNFSEGHWYTQDLVSLGRFYNLYKEQVAHWKAVCGLQWYESDYEALVADPEPNIRRMIDFLGLPWDERCLSHTETERSVMTFSKAQVRQPIYKSSVERWRKYADHIGPLLKELGIEA